MPALAVVGYLLRLSQVAGGQTHHLDPPRPIANLGQQDGDSYSHGRVPWVAAGWTAPAPLVDSPHCARAVVAAGTPGMRSDPGGMRSDSGVAEEGTPARRVAEGIPARLMGEGILGRQAAGPSGTVREVPGAAMDSMSGADTTTPHRNTRRKHGVEMAGRARHHRYHPRILIWNASV